MGLSHGVVFSCATGNSYSARMMNSAVPEGENASGASMTSLSLMRSCESIKLF
jgi:hypothetical protein